MAKNETTETNDGAAATTPAADPEGPAARRLTVHTDDAGKAVIRRAVTLRLAMLGEVGSDDPELHGAALVGIVTEWLKGKSDGLRESAASRRPA